MERCRWAGGIRRDNAALQSEKKESLMTDNPLTTDDSPCQTCGDERTTQRRASFWSISMLCFCGRPMNTSRSVRQRGIPCSVEDGRGGLSKHGTQGDEQESYPNRERTV